MQHRIKTLIVLAITIAGISCQHNEPDVPSVQVDQKAIDQFISLVDMSVEALERHPPKDLAEATSILYGKIPEFEASLGVDLNVTAATRRTAASRVPPESGTGQFSDNRTRIQERIVRYSEVATSADDYLRRLAALKSEIRNSRVSSMERSELLTLVALNEEFVRYLDLRVSEITKSGGKVAPAMKCDGWWSCWGRCVAGTVGGAGLGALTGAAYGGAGCTMVLPVVGTVACGTVGAVAGGIFGGLAGAAASCE